MYYFPPFWSKKALETYLPSLSKVTVEADVLPLKVFVNVTAFSPVKVAVTAPSAPTANAVPALTFVNAPDVFKLTYEDDKLIDIENTR